MAVDGRTSRSQAGPRRPYTIRDQVGLRRIDGYAVSVDGSQVVLAIETIARGTNDRDTHLWSVAADGTDLHRLTRGAGRHSNVVFSPDGRSIYYLSGPRIKDRQVVRQALDGRDPVPVTSSGIDVESFVLSRDGRKIAFAAMVYPGSGDTLAATVERNKVEGKRKNSGLVHDRLFIRHWDEWKTGQRRHIFVQSVDGGPAVDVMPAMDADSPVKPFGGVEQFTFTPDGAGVVFTARDVGREEAWSTDLDLYLAPIDGRTAPRELTAPNRATDTNPTFSPDGTRLAYLAMDRPGYEADKLTVIVQDWPDGATRRLTDGWDRSVDALEWSPDGRTLYLLAEDTGQNRLFALDVATGAIEPIVAQGHAAHPRAVNDAVFYTLDSLEEPADLWSYRAGQHRRLTRLNAAALGRLSMGEAEQFSFPGWAGETVYGYIVKPADFDPSKRYPIAFIIHGGPQSSMNNHWGYRWNPQVYAAAGYGVVMIDFHGSTGYGQAFTDSIRGDWGGKPVEDLQKGYAAALERYPFLDPSRAAALGASFGGYTINLIAGVWNEPWRCLVSHDGNLDERFAYYATEELWFPEWEHGGTPWDNPDGYALHNPVDHVADWRVPMLIIHGARDYRVADTEGLAVFTALQRRGIPSRLLYFPDENHWVLKPQNSVQWHDVVLDWLARWTA